VRQSVDSVSVVDSASTAQSQVRHRSIPIYRRLLRRPGRCTPRNVTDLVDALEAAGLVARGPHPTDRRATLVRLTDAGGAAAARMRDGYVKLGADLFAGLSAEELRSFAGVLDATLARLAGPPAAGATDGPR
jgi:DNA-binding MarR family transcriptional regulator